MIHKLGFSERKRELTKYLHFRESLNRFTFLRYFKQNLWNRYVTWCFQSYERDVDKKDLYVTLSNDEDYIIECHISLPRGGLPPPQQSTEPDAYRNGGWSRHYDPFSELWGPQTKSVNILY